MVDLSEPFAAPILAVDVIGPSYMEAAGALGIRTGTIMRRLFRVREQLASELDAAGSYPRRSSR
jgi:DNA-directed RNA polymerase specialized sigma24 family protein